jgi:hypothetical protein
LFLGCLLVSCIWVVLVVGSLCLMVIGWSVLRLLADVGSLSAVLMLVGRVVDVELDVCWCWLMLLVVWIVVWLMFAYWLLIDCAVVGC